MNTSSARVERELKDFALESPAYLEAHYILNDCFIPENHILENAGKLKDIRTVILHGRYDFICMPSAARDLQQAIGDSALLHFTLGGHFRDIVTREAERAYINMLF